MRRGWLNVALLCILVTLVVTAAGSPSAISIPPSLAWDGVDGTWSTFEFRFGPLGGKLQNVRLLPATSMSYISVVSTQGCNKSVIDWPGGFDVCNEKRGGTYDHSISSGWIGTRSYKLDPMLIMKFYNITNISGRFGTDTVTPGYQQLAGPVSVRSSVIGEVDDWRFSVVGHFGIDPRPTNFSDNSGMDAAQPSFIQNLKQRKVIPSLSYGYTAGAKYQSPPVFGSLTLGGYDAAKRIGNGAHYSMYKDPEIALIVQLAALNITFSTTGPTKTQPVKINKSTAIPMRIDSARPFIYLPIETCQDLAEQLGLTWDPIGEYHYISDENYDVVAATNMTLDFYLTNDGITGDGSSVMISLPFKALVQTLSYPLTGSDKRYIPFRQANKSDQYVLGRTFLQEAYITVNQETHEFSVHKAVTTSEPEPKIVSIQDSSSILSKAAIGGIAAGIATLIALLSIAFMFLHKVKQRRRREAAAAEAARAKDPEVDPQSPTTTNSLSNVPMKVIELDSGTVHEMGGFPSQQTQEIGDPITTVHGELPDESTLSSYGGFIKQEASEGTGMPIIKVYYEMDGTPPDSEQSTPVGTLSSSNDTTLIGSPLWSASGTETGTGSSLNPANNLNLNVDSSSPIPQTPAEFYARPFERQSEDRPNVEPMTPIPQTPLEYYGTAALPGGPGQRGWIGRAPGPEPVELPRVVLTPATPSELTNEERVRSRWLRGHSARGREDGRRGR